MVPIVNIYIRFFYDGISENSIYGLWQSENHKLAISYNEGGRSRKYDWEIVQDGKLLIKNARTQKTKVLKMEPFTLKFTPRKVCFQTFPQSTAITIWICMYGRIIIWLIMMSPTKGLMIGTKSLLGKMALPRSMVNAKLFLIILTLFFFGEWWKPLSCQLLSLGGET